MQSSEKAIGKYLYLEENMSTIKLRENILEPSCAQFSIRPILIF
jgi:hypothetical protein